MATSGIVFPRPPASDPSTELGIHPSQLSNIYHSSGYYPKRHHSYLLSCHDYEKRRSLPRYGFTQLSPHPYVLIVQSGESLCMWLRDISSWPCLAFLPGSSLASFENFFLSPVHPLPSLPTFLLRFPRSSNPCSATPSLTPFSQSRHGLFVQNGSITPHAHAG